MKGVFSGGSVPTRRLHLREARVAFQPDSVAYNPRIVVHAYWAVKCANCNVDLLLADLGPHQSEFMPLMEESSYADPFEVLCEACGQTHAYTRMKVILLLQEPQVRKVS
jgi:hypothetical protein